MHDIGGRGDGVGAEEEALARLVGSGNQTERRRAVARDGGVFG